jgi:hypothetical protein
VKQPVLVQKRYLKAGRHVRLLDLRVRIVAQLLDSGRALGPHAFASFSKAEQAIGVIFAIVSPVTLCQSIYRGVRTKINACAADGSTFRAGLISKMVDLSNVRLL